MQELNELKNLVIQSLESNGALSNIRAQIRASVFKVIDSQDSGSSQKGSPFYWENPKCQKLSEDPNGLLMLQLIKEFLQFYKMDYSLSVYSSESNVKQEVKRDTLNSQLDLPDDDQKPLLYLLLQEYQNGGGGGVIKPANNKIDPPQQPAEASKPSPVSSSIAPGQPAVNNLVGKNEPPKKINEPLSKLDAAQPPPAFDPLDSSTQEKKNLQQAQDIIKQNQAGNLKSTTSAPSAASAFAGQSAPAPNNMNQKFSNMKGPAFDKSGDYENDDFEEQEYPEDLEDDEEYPDIEEPGSKQPKQINPMASSEDFMAASQSQGFDMSVDSMALEGYDYFEQVDKP